MWSLENIIHIFWKAFIYVKLILQNIDFNILSYWMLNILGFLNIQVIIVYYM